MENKVIIANWKSHMHIGEAKTWLFSFIRQLDGLSLEQKTVIICPPFTLLQYVHDFAAANDLPIKIGSQNVSPFPEGAYTGEIAAEQLKEFCEFVVIGHSERRRYFGEDYDLLQKKVEQAQKQELQIIYCVNDEDLVAPKEAQLIAYEPTSAIGTGHPADPEQVSLVIEKLHSPNQQALYGGSVTGEDVANYTSLQNVAGILVGTDSLGADKFIQIIKNA